MIVFQLAEAGATFVETVIVELIIIRAIGAGIIKWRSIIGASGIVTLIILALNQCQLFSAITSVIAIAGYTVSVSFIYREKIAKTLLVAVDCMVLIYIIDFLVISIIGVVFREEKMAEFLTNSFSYMRILFLTFSKGILALIYVIFSRCFLSVVHFMSWKVWASVSLGIVLIYFLVENTLSNTDITSAFTWFLLLAMIIIGAYSFMQYVLLVKEKSRMEMAEEGSRQMRENYESLIQYYRDRQVFFHDLKNHYIVTGSYLKRNEYEKAKNYMEELEDLYPEEPIQKWTGIEALDILIQCKRRRAEIYGIFVEVISDVIQWKLEEREAITLVGNAFDNAIEACRKMSPGSQWIRVTIRNVYEMAFIKVSNSCSREPEMLNGRFLTSKKEKAMHGFGMTSMKLIVDKYEGVMNTDYRDGVFTLTISFYNEL